MYPLTYYQVNLLHRAHLLDNCTYVLWLPAILFQLSACIQIPVTFARLFALVELVITHEEQGSFEDTVLK